MEVGQQLSSSQTGGQENDLIYIHVIYVRKSSTTVRRNMYNWRSLFGHPGNATRALL